MNPQDKKEQIKKLRETAGVSTQQQAFQTHTYHFPRSWTPNLIWFYTKHLHYHWNDWSLTLCGKTFEPEELKELQEKSLEREDRPVCPTCAKAIKALEAEYLNKIRKPLVLTHME